MAAITQEEFNAMSQVAIAQGLPGGNYTMKYSGEEIDAYLGRAAPGGEIDNLRPGENLLDNWYFADPINQRGRTTSTAGGRFIDRWKFDAGSTHGDKIELVSGGVKITNGGYYHSVDLVQRIESPEDFLGKTLTLSAIVTDISVDTKTNAAVICLSSDNKSLYRFAFQDDIALPGLISHTLSIPHDENIGIITVYIGAIRRADTTSAVTFSAAKIELGDHQTLAHQDASGNWVLNDPPPDKALELLKCQRYFQTFATEAQRPTKGLDFRPVMRTDTPTLGTLTLPDGMVLYTASSDF